MLAWVNLELSLPVLQFEIELCFYSDGTQVAMTLMTVSRVRLEINI